MILNNLNYTVGNMVKITNDKKLLKTFHCRPLANKIVTITEIDYINYQECISNGRNKEDILCYRTNCGFFIAERIITKLIKDNDIITIPIKYHNPYLLSLERIEGKKSDWIDLRAAENVAMKAGELKNISLGISMELPIGYEAYVLPRSSTPQNFGIIMANSVGIIDNSYNGDKDVWSFVAYAIRDTTIHLNDRIAQFRIVKNQPEIGFKTVEYLGNPDRGGIGSTGIV